jgi:hypothetical protein
LVKDVSRKDILLSIADELIETGIPAVGVIKALLKVARALHA